MQFLALTTLLAFAFGGVQAYNPIGQPCDSPGMLTLNLLLSSTNQP